MPSLVGNFVLVDDGEHFRTGEILAEITPEYYLVRFDIETSDRVPLPMTLVSVSEMTASHHHWSFFISRAELDSYVGWLNTPSEPRMKVVRPIKPIQ